MNHKMYMISLALIASIGGFLFGFDTAVISGTIVFVKNQFGLSAIQEGWYVSSALLGSIAGVAVAGVLSDRYGRKKVLIISSLFFGVSGAGCLVAIGFSDLVFYRFLGGIGIGMASIISPLYVSEFAPPRSRGRLVALYQFAITIGILCSYFSNAWFLKLSQQGFFGGSGEFVQMVFEREVWRIMLGSELVPAVLYLVLLIKVPESPRWLAVKGRSKEAIRVLSRVMPKAEASKEMSDLQANLLQESGTVRDMFKGPFKKAVWIGIFLAFLTQVSGINAVIYYGPRILEDAGLSINDALGGQVIIGVVNVLFTILALWKIDQLGRRPLLNFGVVGIIISLTVIGLLFVFNVQSSYLLLSFILLFIACFAFSYGPVIWVLLSEIYPSRLRAKVMSIAVLSLWIGTALVGQLTPVMLQSLRPQGTFCAFALLTLPALYLGLFVIPETKGKSLEEIEHYWITRKYKSK
jgi:SP family arabinose:H+ symporter-like MFS transporter